MHRVAHTDEALGRLRDERDHLAIQLSLAADAEASDWSRVDALERKLKAVERSITAYRPAEERSPSAVADQFDDDPQRIGPQP